MDTIACKESGGDALVPAPLDGAGIGKTRTFTG